MNKYTVVFLVFVGIGLTGCGNKNSTSSGGASASSSTVAEIGATDSGGTVQIKFKDNAFIGESVTVEYTVKGQTGELLAGTMHWDDGSDDRVRGNGVIEHTYTSTGTYNIAFQADKELKKAVGTITVGKEPCDLSNPVVEIPALSVMSGPQIRREKFYSFSIDNGCIKVTPTIRVNDSPYISVSHVNLPDLGYINFFIHEGAQIFKTISMGCVNLNSQHNPGNCNTNIALNQTTENISQNQTTERSNASTSASFVLSVGSITCMGEVMLSGFAGNTSGVQSEPVHVLCSE